MKINTLGTDEKICVSLTAQTIKRLNETWNHRFAKEENKEENTMKVSYKGNTGLLQKLERQEMAISRGYILEIWDCSKECKISFSNVSLKDVKFLGGEVTYG